MNKTELIALRIETVTLEQLKKLSEEEERTVSQLIRFAITAYLNKKN